ncbi:Histone-lysine N-methyltransferase SETMAR [Habropoda laboriosa]|uniref:Histone-lysine N-methyltransferase SETMAR n=1 Tax=Habropoda laboriosa TaxID=597456 RepID=A0A0L7QQD1_9HYME|nr:Histone-lysine N-methyltransferase SETMAR [Habropoda laboriosa]
MDKWVPHELSDNRRMLRSSICSSHMLRNIEDSFLDSIATCDEKWVLYDNRKRPGQSILTKHLDTFGNLKHIRRK